MHSADLLRFTAGTKVLVELPRKKRHKLVVGVEDDFDPLFSSGLPHDRA